MKLKDGQSDIRMIEEIKGLGGMLFCKRKLLNF